MATVPGYPNDCYPPSESLADLSARWATTPAAMRAELDAHIERRQQALGELTALDRSLHAFAQQNGQPPKIAELRARVRQAAAPMTDHERRQQSLVAAEQQFQAAKEHLEQVLAECIAAEEAYTRQLQSAHQQEQAVFEATRTHLAKSKARTPSPEAAERRQHTRLEFTTEVGFHTENNFFTGFSRDISEGGVFVATFEDIPLGTSLDLVLRLDDGVEIRAQGEVRWRREWNELTPNVEPGVGVQFQDVSLASLTALREFVARREPLFFDNDDVLLPLV